MLRKIFPHGLLLMLNFVYGIIYHSKLYFFLRFYLFIHERQRQREREREAEIQAEGEAGPVQGA